jgi:citrate synthase
MHELIAAKQVEVKTFNKEFGSTKIGDVTVGQVIGGMRGLPGMLYETSKLHPMDGIEYRGYDLYKVRE